MLAKLFSHRVVKLCNSRCHARSAVQPEEDPRHLLLRIIHAGGLVEYYYMAVPASKIMEKYPWAILARPEVSRRPWESLVQPDEILKLGEKFYVMPRRTVSKLRQRIRRPTVHDAPQSSSTATQAQGNITKSSAPLHPAACRRVLMAATWQPSLTAVDETAPQ